MGREGDGCACRDMGRLCVLNRRRGTEGSKHEKMIWVAELHQRTGAREFEGPWKLAPEAGKVEFREESSVTCRATAGEPCFCCRVMTTARADEAQDGEPQAGVSPGGPVLAHSIAVRLWGHGETLDPLTGFRRRRVGSFQTDAELSCVKARSRPTPPARAPEGHKKGSRARPPRPKGEDATTEY